jgi:hypothetical protein
MQNNFLLFIMQINKKDFKIILNHMNLLSPLEINNLIKQSQSGKTNNNDINQLINTYSPNKVSKLMNKINNNFLISNNMYGGAGADKSAHDKITDIINKLENLKNKLNTCQ